MTHTVWEMPVPASAITRGPTFTSLPKRQCELSFYVEAETGDRKISLIFDDVEAYKCTYLAASSLEMIKAAYGRLADLDESLWLTEISQRTRGYYTRIKKTPPPLRHFAIYFDDGPCFEIICTGFRPVS